MKADCHTTAVSMAGHDDMLHSESCYSKRQDRMDVVIIKGHLADKIMLE